MEIVLQSGNTFVLACKKGEEVVSSLQAFLESQSISAGHFTGLGAAEAIEIAFYDLGTKQYERRILNFDVEILSLVGNCAMKEGRPIIHMHGVFGKRDLSAIGGHVFNIIVSGACELHFTALEGALFRSYDAETGLNQLCPVADPGQNNLFTSEHIGEES